MKFFERRRDADLAAARAQTTAATYRDCAARLQSRMGRNRKWLLASGFGTGVIAGVLPLAVIVRTGNVLLRTVAPLLHLPYGALSRLARNASGAGGSVSN